MGFPKLEYTKEKFNNKSNKSNKNTIFCVAGK